MIKEAGRNGGGSCARWTADEDSIVFDGTRAEIAELLGRTKQAVSARRNRLRGKANAPELMQAYRTRVNNETIERAGRYREMWTADEDEYLETYAGVLPTLTLAQNLGRSYSGVSMRIWTLRNRSKLD